MIIKIRKWP